MECMLVVEAGLCGEAEELRSSSQLQAQLGGGIACCATGEAGPRWCVNLGTAETGQEALQIKPLTKAVVSFCIFFSHKKIITGI